MNVKKFMKKKAKELFPKILEKEWTMKILEFADGKKTYEYYHSFDKDKKRICFIELDDSIKCYTFENKPIKNKVLEIHKKWLKK